MKKSNGGVMDEEDMFEAKNNSVHSSEHQMRQPNYTFPNVKTISGCKDTDQYPKFTKNPNLQAQFQSLQSILGIPSMDSLDMKYQRNQTNQESVGSLSADHEKLKHMASMLGQKTGGVSSEMLQRYLLMRGNIGNESGGNSLDQSSLTDPQLKDYFDAYIKGFPYFMMMHQFAMKNMPSEGNKEEPQTQRSDMMVLEDHNRQEKSSYVSQATNLLNLSDIKDRK